MTTLFSTTAIDRPAPTVRRGRAGVVALWIAQIAAAAMFLWVGGLKLAGATPLVALFDAIGAGRWLRYLTGSIEVVSGLALLVPSLAAFGALLLVPTMAAAVATHLFVVGGSPVPAAVLLIATVAIAWARRDQLADAWSRLH